MCSACHAYERRPAIDWEARRHELQRILDTAPKNGSGFDCIVPSSGGKDSHYQVLTLIELGARPLIVTASTCHLTDIGRANIENLARHATTIEVTPNRRARAKLNRLGLRMVGDISWPEHASIFSTPFRVACQLGIPTIFYGECPQNQYGGPPGSEEARGMTRGWVTEFGGFLGLRPRDLVGMDGLTAHDMADYEPPSAEDLDRHKITAYFLGQFLPWDSHRNATRAAQAGFVYLRPSRANAWDHENLDNAQTGLHDHMMYLKYGYGRGAAQLSVDIRAGRIDRSIALDWVHEHDGTFPEIYAGVWIHKMLAAINMTLEDLYPILDQFTNWRIIRRVSEDRGVKPTLIE